VASTTVELIVKVDPAKAKDPAAHVRRVLASAGIADARAEEVFPGLRTGESAGLVSIAVPAAIPETQRLAVQALKDDTAIRYVQEPKRRKPLSR
jgi:hypothetical protein